MRFLLTRGLTVNVLHCECSFPKTRIAFGAECRSLNFRPRHS